ncbi:hypothetical protein [Paenibacillus sp. FSL L8-0463]|uniref:hypothetical protein n=1 Tax=Paenibacillus sp. FSL L8-0463 TaxID=2954687 RepID=UPI00311919F3
MFIMSNLGQMIGILIFLSSVAAMLYCLIDLEREEKEKATKPVSEPVRRPVYIKSCLYLYQEE